jgi:hypothetical protein
MSTFGNTGPTEFGGPGAPHVKVCLAADALFYPNDGHFWVYLNWALGLRKAGCDVIWLEHCEPTRPADATLEGAELVYQFLELYGFGESFALTAPLHAPAAGEQHFSPLGIADAAEADVLISLNKLLPADVVRRFNRAALIDIDPGMTQAWIKLGQYHLPKYDIHFTVGEGVPARAAGIEWHHIPPCVALDEWPRMPTSGDAAFTTVTHWAGKWFSEGGEYYRNDKRAGFLPFLDLPTHTPHPVELALPMTLDPRQEYAGLSERGWRLCDSATLSEPGAYRQYVQHSLGEFSCAKPSYVRLATAWVSDRTVCYLASGKPAVVQHTGPSSFLPDTGGLFRFRDFQDAIRYLDAAVANYEENCQMARALAEEHFDASKIASRILELTL